MTGFAAATSGVKTTVPTVFGDDKSVFIVGVSKLAWFRMLKNSPRICRSMRSFSLQIFESESDSGDWLGLRVPLSPYTDVLIRCDLACSAEQE
jgi:hypothetical protein